MDGYIINSIDTVNNLAYVTMTFNGSVLDDRVVLSDISDPVGITNLVQNAYNKFQQDITANTNIPVLPAEVLALVGQQIDAATFNQTVATIENTTSIQPSPGLNTT